MNCTACGFEVESGFAFCPKCGTPQPKSCASCGYPCPPDFAFCPKCGTTLAAAGGVSAKEQAPANHVRAPAAGSARPPGAARPETEADRRIVTVLFADLCGYTTLGEQIDPETLRALQNEIFEALGAVVAAHGGYVDKFVGDALLALFGAPVAHEKDPERALCAALEMQHRMARIEEHWQARLGQPLTLHIGVNTGPVVAGTVGAGDSKSYSVTGDTVNTAQRLQAMAGPDEVLVGAVTRRLTQHAFSFASLGTMPLRGKTGETPVYRLEAPVAAPPTARGLGSFGIAMPLIGRDGELSSLLRCLDFVRAGATQLVRIVGDAGIGKTRLVEAFLDRLRADPELAGITIRQTACSSLGEPSYGTLAAMLRCAYQIDPMDNLDRSRMLLVSGLAKLGLPADDVKRLEPFLHFGLGFGDPLDALKFLQPDQLRRQIFHAVRTLFDRRMEQSPLLLVIEDLHWADGVSLEALRFIMDRIERRWLMLLVTHRHGFETEVLSSGRASQTTLRLNPLSEQEAEALLSGAFGPGVLSPGLCSRIAERAEGNPFFVEEILRTLIETGALRREGNGWVADVAAAETETPLGIQAMMLARIDRLPPDARRLAQV
ncbi:MAG TPA: adenylate/guanylate cyclase domain-containing protein, partial [Mycoplana sp.]|nr:adenylate/guanylate cyclase domain-containing protein [Mycoplana sp.]